jgi:hypothetical protein
MVQSAVEARAIRLRYWNRLFRGLPVSSEDLDLALASWARTAPNEERRAFILLRACVGLFSTSRWAVRHALRVAILYWFSNVGTTVGRRRTVRAKRSSFHLSDALGTGLTWDEAVACMGRKPLDFSAYLWILEVLEASYCKQWSEIYGSPPLEPGERIGLEGAEGHVPLV